MKKILRRVGCVFLILCCAFTAYPAFLIAMEWENESQGRIYGDLYIFDSKNILSRYQKGEEDLFEIIPWEDINDEVYENLPEYPPSKWKQQDYLNTLDIFYEKVFERPFPKKIRAARFSLPDCSQISFGPQSALIFTAEVSLFSVESYSYDVGLNDGIISYRGDTYDPILSWPISSLDLTEYKITAEEALQIAEEQGGEEIRLANQNQCSIDINIDSSHRHGNWVISYASNIDRFTTLLAVAVDANTGRHKIITEGGAGYYSFDPQQIKNLISDEKKDIFTILTNSPEDNLMLPPEHWTQQDYYQIAEVFNRHILHEDLGGWMVNNISFELNCDDVEYGPQQMRFRFWKIHAMDKLHFVQDILIEPQKGLITSNYEYNLDVNRFELFQLQDDVLDWSEIQVSGDEALQIVYEAEGKHLHQALREHQKSCKMTGWLMDFSDSMDPESMEWDIGIWKENAEALGEKPDQLTAFVSIKTGALYYFKHYYGGLVK